MTEISVKMSANSPSGGWPICHELESIDLSFLEFIQSFEKHGTLEPTHETAPAGPVRHLSDRSIRSMDRSQIFDISGTGPRSLISKQMN